LFRTVLGNGPIGALVSAWPALALAGSFELLMLLVRAGHQADDDQAGGTSQMNVVPALAKRAPSLEQIVRDWHEPGQSQRAIARELSIDRRKVKQIIEGSMTT